MNSLESHSNTEINYYFLFFVVTLIFGVFFIEFIGFDPLDELLEVLLVVLFLVLSIWKGELRFGKMGVIWLTSFLFYLGYSFYIGSNAPKAILLDVLLQAKPFIAFFCIYYSGQKMSEKEKYVLRIIVLILYGFALFALAASFMFRRFSLGLFFGHETRYATAIVILGLLYLYTSAFTWKNRIIFLLMLAAGLFSFKGKFFGFYAFSVLMVLIYNRHFYLKVSFRNLFFGAVAIIFVFWAAQDKILYYGQGFFLDKSIEDHNIARPILYLTSFEILQDYFPFGSGFGSFATHASRVVYSPIYEAYGLSSVWGLSEELPDFIADTHFPSLAQFGIVGVILFLLFWRALIKQANAEKLRMPDKSAYFFIVMVFVFLMIEMVADAAFTNNRGFFAMLFLGYLFNEYQHQSIGELK
jgi:hypothetical protein